MIAVAAVVAEEIYRCIDEAHRAHILAGNLVVGLLDIYIVGAGSHSREVVATIVLALHHVWLAIDFQRLIIHGLQAVVVIAHLHLKDVAFLKDQALVFILAG